MKSNSNSLTHNSIKFKFGIVGLPIEINSIQDGLSFGLAMNWGYLVPKQFAMYPATYWAACTSSWENESF